MSGEWGDVLSERERLVWIKNRLWDNRCGWFVFGGSRENLTGGKELGFGCLILLESLQRRGVRIALGLGLMRRVSGHRRKLPERVYKEKRRKPFFMEGDGEKAREERAARDPNFRLL